MTQSLEDYLETIFLIIQDKKLARVKDVSEKISVRKPSVINAVKELEQRGYVVHEKYGHIELTEEGMREAKKIYKIHTLIRDFLIRILGVSEETAEQDACKIEHVISSETLSHMKTHLDQNTSSSN